MADFKKLLESVQNKLTETADTVKQMRKHYEGDLFTNAKTESKEINGDAEVTNSL